MFSVLLLLFSSLLLADVEGKVMPRSQSQNLVIRLQANRTSIGMGKTLKVVALVTHRDGRSVPGIEVWPYVNGRQWGAPAKTDAKGRALLLIPLPTPGVTRIQALLPSQTSPLAAYWIWSNTLTDGQEVFFRKVFRVSGKILQASLRITCDDQFVAYLNGHPIARGNNFQQVQFISHLERWLKTGQNFLAVEGKNGVGPAGLLARLEIEKEKTSQIIVTDGTWEVLLEKPSSWPNKVSGAGQQARVLAPVGQGVWGKTLQNWPGLSSQSTFPVGSPLPKQGVHSNVLRIQVYHRPIHTLWDPEHLVGIEWEPWFTPLNTRWDTAEAMPLLGYYDSFNPEVIRQHCLWMVEAGINFLLVDWTNNLWGKQHWAERSPYVDDLIRATTRMLDTYAQMKQEGIPVPQVVFILGLDNGPTTTTTAVNEEMQWIYENYVSNPRYQGLWLYYLGKPLILVFNGGGPGIRKNQPPVEDRYFTVRWMASQLQINRLDREGYWSWMDGTLHPIPTFYQGQAEALTVTPAFFGEGGWTYPQARGRRGGTTYIEEFKTALQYRPRFLIINQWNEFAGQYEGMGYGPQRDQYVDCYNAELSNDIEPTSLTACAYRGCGGWGFYYLNLTRALIHLYHQKAPETTLMAISNPRRGEILTGPTLKVEWAVIGKPPKGFTLMLDGHVILQHFQGTSYVLELGNIRPGRHILKIIAEGAVTQFPLSLTEEDTPLPKPVPLAAQVPFFVK